MKKLINLLFLIVFFTINGSAQLKNLGLNVNSVHNEIRPVVSENGRVLYFTVEGRRDNGYKDGQDIWMARLGDSGTWKKAQRLPPFINSQKYNGVYWTNPDGTKILVRGNYREANANRGFSMVSLINGDWSTPKELQIEDYRIISKGTYTGATLSSDEKVLIMYFSDELHGEYNDIWLSRLNEATGKYSKPVKLNISEDEYDEISPYIAPDDKTLFYSSDRPGGLGGHDIWMVKRLDTSWKNWSEPVNIGAPFNTSAWDAYFSIGNNELGYVATNTKMSLPSALGGVDIKSDTLPDFLRPEKPVVQEEPLIINDTIHDTVTITIYKNIPCNPLDTMTIPQLTKEMVKTKILFDFGSSTLRSDAYQKLDILLAMLRKDKDLKIELGGHTDAIGNSKRNLTQSEDRAMAAKAYLIAHGVEVNRITIKGYSNTKPISDNTTDAGRQLNRRVDIKVIEK